MASFFSWSGQAERLRNVAATFKDIFTGKSSLTVNTNNPVGKAIAKSTPLKTAVEVAANNPFTTAAIATTAVSSVGRAAVAKVVTSLTPVQKAIGGTAVLVAAPALVSSPKAQTTVLKTIGSATPEKLVAFGSSVGKTIENPTAQNVKNLVTENKGVIAVGAVSATVLGATKLLPTIATYQNTQAMQANTKAAESQVVAESPIKLYDDWKARLKAAEQESEIRIKEAKLANDIALEQTKAQAEAQKMLIEAQTKAQEQIKPVQAIQPAAPAVLPITPQPVTTKKKATRKKATKKKKKKSLNRTTKKRKKYATRKSKKRKS